MSYSEHSLTGIKLVRTTSKVVRYRNIRETKEINLLDYEGDKLLLIQGEGTLLLSPNTSEVVDMLEGDFPFNLTVLDDVTAYKMSDIVEAVGGLGTYLSNLVHHNGTIRINSSLIEKYLKLLLNDKSIVSKIDDVVYSVNSCRSELTELNTMNFLKGVVCTFNKIDEKSPVYLHQFLKNDVERLLKKFKIHYTGFKYTINKKKEAVLDDDLTFTNFIPSTFQEALYCMCETVYYYLYDRKEGIALNSTVAVSKAYISSFFSSYSV